MKVGPATERADEEIESPKTGDDTRSFYPPSAPALPHADVPRPDLPGESAYFMQANRNKRSYVQAYTFADERESL